VFSLAIWKDGVEMGRISHLLWPIFRFHRPDLGDDCAFLSSPCHFHGGETSDAKQHGAMALNLKAWLLFPFAPLVFVS